MAFLITLPVDVVERGDNQVDAVLHVTSEATGETFEAYFDGEMTDSERFVKGWIDLDAQSLPSGGMIEIQLPVNPPWGPAWFGDERLHKPGSYRLRLQILAKELGMPEDLWSSEATLVVRHAEGVDAEALAWLQDRPKGGWKWGKWTDELAREVIAVFPSSDYARYGIGTLTRKPPPASTPWLRKAVELSEGTWLADYYRIHLLAREARWDASCGDEPSGHWRAQHRACMARIIGQISEKARAIAVRTSSPAIRQLAENMQRGLKEQAENIRAERGE